MQIHIQEYGLDELIFRLDGLGSPERRAAAQRKALRAGIRFVEQYTKTLMTGSRSGHTYMFLGVSHRASAPGEPPAVDTGNLKNSLRVLEVTDTSASFGTSVDYAAHLEYGTRNMAARPFMRPAAENNVEAIEQIMAYVFDETLNGR